ncbi:class I SAM-dependent methyltransferase [Cystobacter fuscus]|uniref:class I SAM-dependent methyltransferase n=1 Tax=Cystobacter fuscus TaxID=43 RepID=UPI0037BE5E9E
MGHTAEYDSLAEEYQQSKLIPFRLELEHYSLFEQLGELRGKRVLDLACGEGFYSRQMKRRGAATVHGVDVSPAMIELAQESERHEPLGCTYAVGDVAGLERLGDFDRVVGCYLLNQARTREQLLDFCRAIHRNLAPGGRFVGVADNPRGDPKHYAHYRPYGLTKQVSSPRTEGSLITLTFFNPDGTSFQLTQTYLSPESYEWAFREAGFSSFQWVPVRARPHQDPETAGFWRRFVEMEPLVLVEARSDGEGV